MKVGFGQLVIGNNIIILLRFTKATGVVDIDDSRGPTLMSADMRREQERLEWEAKARAEMKGMQSYCALLKYLSILAEPSSVPHLMGTIMATVLGIFCLYL
jgi:hypothetical protein